MSPEAKRLLIRFAGFFGAAVGVALWRRPWAEYMSSHMVAGWVWAFIGGLVGLIVTETIRKRLAGQGALERAEEDALSDETIRKLRRDRLLCRLIFTIGVPVWADFSLGIGECFQYPGVCAFATGVYMIFGYLLGEFVAMLDPRQRVYSRIARRRRTD